MAKIVANVDFLLQFLRRNYRYVEIEERGAITIYAYCRTGRYHFVLHPNSDETSGTVHFDKSIHKDNPFSHRPRHKAYDNEDDPRIRSFFEKYDAFLIAKRSGNKPV